MTILIGAMVSSDHKCHSCDWAYVFRRKKGKKTRYEVLKRAFN